MDLMWSDMWVYSLQTAHVNEYRPCPWNLKGGEYEMKAPWGPGRPPGSRYTKEGSCEEILWRISSLRGKDSDTQAGMEYGKNFVEQNVILSYNV